MRLRQVAKVNSFAPHRAESCCPGALMQRTMPGLRSKATKQIGIASCPADSCLDPLTPLLA